LQFCLGAVITLSLVRLYLVIACWAILAAAAAAAAFCLKFSHQIVSKQLMPKGLLDPHRRPPLLHVVTDNLSSAQGDQISTFAKL
jgi:hypothetical protein